MFICLYSLWSHNLILEKCLNFQCYQKVDLGFNKPKHISFRFQTPRQLTKRKNTIPRYSRIRNHEIFWKCTRLNHDFIEGIIAPGGRVISRALWPRSEFDKRARRTYAVYYMLEREKRLLCASWCVCFVLVESGRSLENVFSDCGGKSTCVRG